MMSRRLLVAVVVTVLSLIAVVGVVLVSRSSGPVRHPDLSATRIDLGSDRSGEAAALGDGAMWILASGGGAPKAVERVDPVSLRVTHTYSLGFHARYDPRGI